MVCDGRLCEGEEGGAAAAAVVAAAGWPTEAHAMRGTGGTSAPEVESCAPARQRRRTHSSRSSADSAMRCWCSATRVANLADSTSDFIVRTSSAARSSSA